MDPLDQLDQLDQSAQWVRLVQSAPWVPWVRLGRQQSMQVLLGQSILAVLQVQQILGLQFRLSLRVVQ